MTYKKPLLKTVAIRVEKVDMLLLTGSTMIFHLK